MCQKLCHPSKVWDAQYVYPAHGGRATLAVYSNAVVDVETDELSLYFGHKWIAASGSAPDMHFNRSLATYMINAPDGNFPYSNDTLPDPGKQY